MKTIAEYTDLAIPNYALPYLVNDDPSGLNSNDLAMITRYMQPFYEEAEKVSGHVIFSPGEEIGEFKMRPEFGLGCDVSRCTILIVS